MATLCNTNLPEFRTSQFGRADSKHCASPETAQTQWKQSQSCFYQQEFCVNFVMTVSPAACSLQPALGGQEQLPVSRRGKDERTLEEITTCFFFFFSPSLLSGHVDLRDDSLLCDSHLCAETQHTPSFPLTSPPHPAPVHESPDTLSLGGNK